jgi:hypothetical protein
MTNPLMLLMIANALPLTGSAPTNGALSASPGGALPYQTAYVKSTWVLGNGETLPSTETSLALGQIPAPAAPTLATATTGGTILAGVYEVVTSYVNAAGETVGSVNSSINTTGSTSTITITSPPALDGATGWYAYVSQDDGTVASATRQQTAGSPTAIGTNLTLTAPPTSTGATAQTVNGTGELLTVAAPSSPPTGATGWNVYVSFSTGTEQRQNATTIPLGTAWQMPASGLVTGVTVPTGNVLTGEAQLLNVSPFIGGRNHNAILNFDTTLSGIGAGVITISGNYAAAGGPAPGPSDPNWSVIATINENTAQVPQEIQLPTWLAVNVQTAGTGTFTAHLFGIQ